MDFEDVSYIITSLLFMICFYLFFKIADNF